MEKKEHIIWQDENLNLDDWREDLQEEYPELTDNEDELYAKMVERNTDYLSDERINLGDIVIPNGILLVATLGLWNGRRRACKVIKSGKVADCLYTEEQGSAAWYVDEEGEFRARIHHHDGTNLYHCLAIRDSVSEEELEELCESIIDGKDCRERWPKMTYRLGDLIGDVYGWDFPNRPESTKL